MAAFYILAALTLVSGLLMITARNPVAAVIWMILSLTGVAGIFLTLSAEFIAIIQVLVYAGAIMVLFLFVIMLLNLRAELVVSHTLPQKIVAALLGLALLYEVVLVARAELAESAKGPFDPAQVAKAGNSEMVARLLFSDYLFPFEIVSLLLLVAIIGAIVLARREF